LLLIYVASWWYVSYLSSGVIGPGSLCPQICEGLFDKQS